MRWTRRKLMPGATCLIPSRLCHWNNFVSCRIILIQPERCKPIVKKGAHRKIGFKITLHRLMRRVMLLRVKSRRCKWRKLTRLKQFRSNYQRIAQTLRLRRCRSRHRPKKHKCLQVHRSKRDRVPSRSPPHRAKFPSKSPRLPMM